MTPEESRISVDGIRCADMEAFWSLDQIGAFIVVDEPSTAAPDAPVAPVLWAKLPAPGGGYEHVRLPLQPSPPNSVGASWYWDGNRERPTLSPSVHCHGVWHGWVRGGRFESV